jgi:hypothetical protein
MGCSGDEQVWACEFVVELYRRWLGAQCARWFNAAAHVWNTLARGGERALDELLATGWTSASEWVAQWQSASPLL